MSINGWVSKGKSGHVRSWNKVNSEGVGFVYIYDKGWFRNHEDSFVVSTSITGGSNPVDRENIPFSSESKAMAYARKFMKEN